MAALSLQGFELGDQRLGLSDLAVARCDGDGITEPFGFGTQLRSGEQPRCEPGATHRHGSSDHHRPEHHVRRVEDHVHVIDLRGGIGVVHIESGVTEHSSALRVGHRRPSRPARW